MTLLKAQAIQTAIAGDWNTAVILNEELLKTDPDDIEALNRLAFALTVIGKIKDAKYAYQRVLKLDSHNPIALKNLKRLTEAPKRANSFQAPQLRAQIDTLFLEESGKTKIIGLVNVAQPKVIAPLMTAELLELRIKRLKIFVLDKKNRYIGMLPEDIGKRLIKLLKAGNKYETCVKSIENHRISIFIKETKRCSRFKNQPSFISADFTKTFSPKKHYPPKDLDDSPDERSEEES